MFDVDNLDSFGPGFEFTARRDGRSCEVSMTDLGSVDDPVGRLIVEELSGESMWTMRFDCG